MCQNDRPPHFPPNLPNSNGWVIDTVHFFYVMPNISPCQPPWLFPVPEGLDAIQAVALPLQGLTAYQTLVRFGHLQAGERILIQAAAGGVGTLAIQLARLLGAGQIIATASTPALPSPSPPPTMPALPSPRYLPANLPDAPIDCACAHGPPVASG